MAKFGKGDLYDAKKREAKPHSLLVWVPDSGAYHLPDENGKLTDKVGGYFAQVMLDQSLFDPKKIKSGETKLMVSGKEDQGSMKGKVQTNPYLNNYLKEFKNKEGKTVKFTAHNTRYTASQIAAIAQATTMVPEGKPATNIRYKNGTLYAINAPLFIKNKFIPKKDKDGKNIPRFNKKGERVMRRDKDGNLVKDKNGNYIQEVEGYYTREVLINTKGKMGPTKNHKFGLDTMKLQNEVTKVADDKYREMREAAEAQKHDPQAQANEIKQAQTKGLTAETDAPGFGENNTKTAAEDMSQKMDNVAKDLKQSETKAPENKIPETKTPTAPTPKATEPAINKEVVSTPVAGATTPSNDNSLQAGADQPQTGGDSTLANEQQRKSAPTPVPKASPSAADDEPSVDSLPF